VAREGFLKDKCGPRAKKFENHWCRLWRGAVTAHTFVGVQHQQWTVVI